MPSPRLAINNSLSHLRERRNPFIKDNDQNEYKTLIKRVPSHMAKIHSHSAAFFPSAVYIDQLDSHFMLWFTIATWFPLFAGILGPLSSLTSVMALCSNWSDDADKTDPSWTIALNSLSLGFGFIANIFLLLNFSRHVRYTLCQIISISFWALASAILVSILAAYVYLAEGPNVLSQAFWYGVMTCIFYGICAVLLAFNEIGYLWGFLGPSFNLDSRQRTLMFQYLALMLWLGLGCGIYRAMMKILVADALYFCVVTVLTIGLGDIAPSSNLERALDMPYAFVGVVIIGLIVASIRGLVLQQNNVAMMTVYADKRRHHAYKKEKARQKKHSSEEQFHKLRMIHYKTRRYRLWLAFGYVIFIFICFWLIGACVFSFIEDRSYFIYVYFCALCFLTIGYGDVPLTHNGSRVFFFFWALFAIPIMTILISEMDDTLFSSIRPWGERFIRWALPSGSDMEKKEIDARKELYRNLLDSGYSSAAAATVVGEAKGDTSPSESINEGFQAANDAAEENLPPTAPAGAGGAIGEFGTVLGSQDEGQPSNQKLGNGSDNPSNDDDQQDSSKSNLRELKDANADSPVAGEYRKALISWDRTILRASHLVQLGRRYLRDAHERPNKKYSYDEWQKLMQLCGTSPDRYFWLGPTSPLRFTTNEPEYFLKKINEQLMHITNNDLVSQRVDSAAVEHGEQSSPSSNSKSPAAADT